MAQKETRRLRAVEANPFTGIEQRRAQDLADVDDEIVACRARGNGGHAWPRLSPRRALPGNYLPTLQRDGTVMVTEVCAVYEGRKVVGGCGKKRWYMLGAGGIYEQGAKKNYQDPKNWVRIPRDWGYSSRDFDAENVRRLNERIMTEARRRAAASEAGAS